MGASLAAHLMPLVASVGPPTLSLAQGVLIALVTGAGTGAVVVLTKLGLEEAAAKGIRSRTEIRRSSQTSD